MSVMGSGFERKVEVGAVLVFSITFLIFNQEKQNADHIGSVLVCPTVFWTTIGPKC